MYTYKERADFFQSLRCETSLTYISLLVLLSLLISNPIYLAAVFIALNLVIHAAGIMNEWIVYLKYCLVLVLFIILINAIFVNAGSTILFSFPDLPLLGKIRITLEAVSYGIGMGLRLLIMMGAFCLLTYSVDPDLLLKTFGGGKSRIMLALSMSLRLFPLIADDFMRITEAQRCRGVDFKVKSKRKRVRNYLPVLNTVLLSILERSFQMAEALQSKAYGTCERSHFSEKLWRPRDIFVFAATLVTAVITVVFLVAGHTAYNYYPRLQAIGLDDALAAIVIGFGVLIPALLTWGWKKWPYWRLKI